MLIPRTLTFIFHEEKVLLIKGAPHKRLWANKYNGVGGHIERGEDVFSSARREVREETGLDLPSLALCGTVIVDTGENVGIGIFIFRGEYQGGNLAVPRRESGMDPARPAGAIPTCRRYPRAVRKSTRVRPRRDGAVFSQRTTTTIRTGW